MRLSFALVLTLAVPAVGSAQPPEQLPPPPVAIPIPPPPGPVETVQVFKIDRFAKGFQPLPGTHRVAFVHPYTGKPAEVTFDLPPGKPTVRTSKRELVFDYGKKEVKLRFYRDGGHRVDYER
jgi:hypothetical protein